MTLHTQTVQTNPTPKLSQQGLDVAGEIAKFADLRKKGILTDDEFDAKKKQLLNL